MKNKQWTRGVLLFALVVIASSLVFAGASTSVGTEICKDPAKYKECFYENPSATNLLFVSNPTEDDFKRLEETSMDQAGLYILAMYDTEFAAEYVGKSDLTRPSGPQTVVAELFFSEDPHNLAAYKEKFQDFMKSQDVSISLVGDISAYKTDGTLIADNGQVNIKKLKGKYGFLVNDDDEIVLVKRTADGATREYTFEGTMTTNAQGNIKMQGEGVFNGLDVENVDDLRIGEKGNYFITGEKVGALDFRGKGFVVYNPSEKLYTVKDAVLEEYPEYRLTGAIKVDEGLIVDDYYIPEGRKLEIYSNDNPLSQLFQTEKDAHRILANGGKDVQIDLRDNTWEEDPKGFIVEKITGLATGEEKEDKVSLDAKGNVFLESTDAPRESAASYRVEIGTGTLYATENTAEEDKRLLALPEKGYYEKGDYPAESSRDRKNIELIQKIIGETPDGSYGPRTKAAVLTWENNYNMQYNLKPGDEGYVIPDGKWGEEETLAHIKMMDQLEEPALALNMRGGAAGVSLEPEGVKVTESGNLDMDIEGIRVAYRDGKVDKELAKVVEDKAELPVEVATINKDGEEETVLITTEERYGFDSLSEGFASGQIKGYCALAKGTLDPSKAACASYVTELAEVEGGVYNRYGGFAESFARYTGQIGSTWEKSANIRARDGETVYWKEDPIYGFGELRYKSPLLAFQVPYDQNNFEAGDNIDFYYTKSKFLGEAYSEGLDGRQATHTAKVVGKKAEAYTVRDDAIKPVDYLKRELDLKGDITNAIASGYPVWVNGERVKYSGGEYYYVDAQENPTGNPITLQSNDQVIVEKTMISHLYHRYEGDEDPIREEDYGWFLANNPDFSLYEQVRPDEKKYAELQKLQAETKRVPIEKEEDIEDALRKQGVTEEQLPLAVEYTKRINNIQQEGTKPGDVIAIPTKHKIESVYDETIGEKMKVFGITNGDEIAKAVEASTDERTREYGIPEEDKNDLAEATIAIGSLQTYWQAPKGVDIENELWREQYLAEVEEDTGIVPESVSYGYLQVQDKVAEKNARDLGLNDYDNPTDITDSVEGSVKHGQREVARLWKRYAVDNEYEGMEFEEKLGLVALAYNRGEDAPMIVATQEQLTDLGYSVGDIDGDLGDMTLDALKQFSKDNGISFDREQAKENMEETEAYKSMKQKYKETFETEPLYATTMKKDETYVVSMILYCGQMTPIRGRCSRMPFS